MENHPVVHKMTGKVVNDGTFAALTSGLDGTARIGMYDTLAGGKPLFIMISGMQ